MQLVSRGKLCHVSCGAIALLLVVFILLGCCSVQGVGPLRSAWCQSCSSRAAAVAAAVAFAVGLATCDVVLCSLGSCVHRACVRSDFVPVRVCVAVAAGAAGIIPSIMVQCVLCVSVRACAVSISPVNRYVREFGVLCGIGVARSSRGPGGARSRCVLAARAGVTRIARAPAIPLFLVNGLIHVPYTSDS